MAESSGNGEPATRRRALKFAGVLASALLVAMVTAIGTGLGSGVLDRFGGGNEEPDPISYSASEQIAECGTALFFPAKQVSRARSSDTGVRDWEGLRTEHGGAVAGGSVVQVSIQGESARTVTLTGIDFMVKRRPRPPGAIISKPCGDAIYGRYIRANLDRQPVAVSGSADDPKAQVDEVSGATQGSYKPITFPWEVSVTDSLLLQIIASTKRCFCTWRAEIPWSSGELTGKILIDNRGRGYTVVGMEGARGVEFGTE